MASLAPRSKEKTPDPRDTARDLIHGYQPTGEAARAPRDPAQRQRQQNNEQQNTTTNVRNENVNRRAPGGVVPGARPAAVAQRPQLAPVATPGAQQPVGFHAPQQLAQAEQRNRGQAQELQRVQGQLAALQRQQAEVLQREQQSRQRLEQQLAQNQQLVGRMGDKVREGEAHNRQQIGRDIDDMRRQGSELNAKVLHVNQDLAHMKNIVDLHSGDLQKLNQEVKSRPIADPAKASSAQQMDAKMRDLHGQMMGLRQLIDQEMNDRRNVDQAQAQNVAKLQDFIEKQDLGKSEVLQSLAKQGEQSTATMNEETRRLNEKIAIITEEVTRSMMEKEHGIRNENQQNYLTLEKAIKAELEARLQYEKDVRKFLEDRWGNYSQELSEIKTVQSDDRQKYKDRFQKLSEALVILEKHLEQGNKKMDKLMAAEIKARKIHEKNLLTKVADVEARLGTFLTSLDKSIEDAKNKRDTKAPQINMDGLRREMDAISADKHKLSMEGLLKLEEKMRRIDIGLNKDRRELMNKLEDVGDRAMIEQLRRQLQNLAQIQENLAKAHERVVDKVERQTPQDLNELSQKLENFKKQMNSRIDKEEEERYLAVKELQDAVEQLRTGATPGGTAATNQGVQREIDQCKVDIKRLATTVAATKSALERRLEEEIRGRERNSDAAQRQPSIADSATNKHESVTSNPIEAKKAAAKKNTFNNV